MSSPNTGGAEMGKDGPSEAASDAASEATSAATSIRRVAVTGASGRVGSAVTEHLLEQGYEVVALDRRQPQKRLPRFVYCDLRRRELIQPVFETVDAVIHLGEIPNTSFPLSPEEIFAQNTAVGSCVLQTAADLRLKRVIYTSSCQVYGFWGEGFRPVVPQTLPMDETHPLQPTNVYSLSKTCNESYARLMAEAHGLSVAVFRLPWVVTREPNDDWFRWLERDNNGRSEGLATYIHARDVASAYRLALERPRAGWHAYHLTAAEACCYQPLRQYLESRHPEFPKLPSDWPAYKSAVLLDKAREHFGWEPTFSFLESYRQKTGKKLPGDQ